MPGERLFDQQHVAPGRVNLIGEPAGDYGVRRREVEAGQAILKVHFPQSADLGHASLDELEACRVSMSPESHRRCHHIISENDRVRHAKAAIPADDMEWLGDLMTRSHVSQRDDFACSCEEIDFLVVGSQAIGPLWGAVDRWGIWRMHGKSCSR
jgi:galactokinase